MDNNNKLEQTFSGKSIGYSYHSQKKKKNTGS